MPSRAPQPAVPAFTTGEAVTQEKLAALVEHALLLYEWSVGGYRSKRPMCVARATGGAVNDFVSVPLALQQEIVDTDGMFTPGNSFMWIRTPGVYLLELQAALQPQAAGIPADRYFSTLILINGLDRETDTVACDKARAAASQNATSHCSALVPLDAGTIVYFCVEQNTGTGSTNVNLEVNDGGCRASAEWVGPLAPEIGEVQ